MFNAAMVLGNIGVLDIHTRLSVEACSLLYGYDINSGLASLVANVYDQKSRLNFASFDSAPRPMF